MRSPAESRVRQAGNNREHSGAGWSNLRISVQNEGREASRLSLYCALNRNESEEKSHAFLFECGWYRGNIPSRNVRFDVPGLFLSKAFGTERETRESEEANMEFMTGKKEKKSGGAAADPERMQRG